jgi:hypothetical protein
VAAVVALYYGVADTERKAALLDEGLREATDFTDLTTKREAAREGAHADLVRLNCSNSNDSGIWRMHACWQTRLDWSSLYCFFPIPIRNM